MYHIFSEFIKNKKTPWKRRDMPAQMETERVRSISDELRFSSRWGFEETVRAAAAAPSRLPPRCRRSAHTMKRMAGGPAPAGTKRSADPRTVVPAGKSPTSSRSGMHEESPVLRLMDSGELTSRDRRGRRGPDARGVPAPQSKLAKKGSAHRSRRCGDGGLPGGGRFRGFFGQNE